LFICWLIVEGGWAQVKINWGSTSAVMETSMAYFYASGVLFALSGAVILLNDLWRLVSGQLAEGELVGIRENEDMPTGNPHP
jgi:TRAP-type C4-dicarboxylate transport system permease small subunit